jgi:hypothetical protein
VTGAVSPPPDELERGRDAYARKAWREPYDEFSSAEAEAPLGGHDLQLLATTTYMLGRMDDFLGLVERAHHAYLGEGDLLAAIRGAVYLGINLSIRGDTRTSSRSSASPSGQPPRPSPSSTASSDASAAHGRF